MKDLFQDQQGKPGQEGEEWDEAMMVLFVPMIKGISPDTKGQDDHTDLKTDIVDDVQAKKRKAAQEKW